MSSEIEKLTQRLQKLEAKEAIRSLMGRYIDHATSGEFEKLAELFSEDGVLVLRDKKAKTRAGIAEWMRENLPHRATGQPGSWNINGSIDIRVKGTTAEATSFWFFAGRRVDQGKLESMVGAGRYLDQFVKQGETWLIRSRFIEVGFLVPLAVGWAGGQEFYDLVQE